MKIRNLFGLIGCMISTMLCLFTYSLSAQNNPSNETPGKIIDKEVEYRSLITKDTNQRMVELKALIPELAYDLRYASANNFVHRPVYPVNTRHTYLRLPAARALLGVQQELRKMGLGLKIFDAYRPYQVTCTFWELIKDERYVAHPQKGSGHNRGLSVDLTLMELDTGNEMDMGTGFDNFSDTAHHSFSFTDSSINYHRHTLKTTMEKAGFVSLESEWWHYSWPGKERYDIMNLSFRDLRRLERLR